MNIRIDKLKTKITDEVDRNLHNSFNDSINNNNNNNNNIIIIIIIIITIIIISTITDSAKLNDKLNLSGSFILWIGRFATIVLA